MVRVNVSSWKVLYFHLGSPDSRRSYHVFIDIRFIFFIIELNEFVRKGFVLLMDFVFIVRYIQGVLNTHSSQLRKLIDAAFPVHEVLHAAIKLPSIFLELFEDLLKVS